MTSWSRRTASRSMLWELKRTQETDLTRFEDQLTRYVLAAGVTHAVLCNGRKVRVYQRVGDALRFSYTFPLTVFASSATPPPSTHDEQRVLTRHGVVGADGSIVVS